MPVRKVSFATGEFYHLYNRGNSRQRIFLTEQDHERFMMLLYVANGTRPLDLREVKPEDAYNFERGEQQTRRPVLRNAFLKALSGAFLCFLPPKVGPSESL
jgi:hypothetical protein